jgi:response regulator RpfG family c-di-GMP phosphodiesterase
MPAASDPTPKLRLLIVDDEPAICEALARALRPEGHAISAALDGESALALLERTPVAVVVSDMRMPGMNGAELLGRIASLYPATVRILLTGYADHEAAVSAINQGRIFRYLTKPWKDEELKLALREAFALHAHVAAQTAQLAAANIALEQRFASMLEVFASLLRARLRHTASEQRAMATLARAMAERLKLDPAACEDVYRAALLCDLGKLALSDEILRVSEKALAGEMLQEFRRHPLVAEASLALLPPLDRVAVLIRHHRERHDGMGYPDGLSGNAIPVGSRILAVAHDYDAALHGELTGHACSREAAQDIIEAGAGTAYEPAVASALTHVLGDHATQGDASTEITVAITRLEPGMLVSRDVFSPHGALLLREGVRLDERTIEVLSRLAWSGGLDTQIPVRVA